MRPLYLIADDIRHLLDSTEDGELTDAALDQLDTLTGDFNAKVETYCMAIREKDAKVAVLQAEIEQHKAEIKRIQALQVPIENDRDRMKDRLMQAMVMSGQPKVATPLFRVNVQASPPSARCLVDPETLNVHFQRKKIEPDAKAAIEWWKVHGEPPTGFEVVQGDHLRIR